MDMNQVLAAELNVKPWQVEAAVKLIDEGNTIPFISRYRKEATGSLNDEILRNLYDRLMYLRSLNDRKAVVLASIEEQGKLTAELKKSIEEAATLVVVEDLYRPYRPKRRTRATIAKEKGLEPLANIILLQMTKEPLEKEAEAFVSEEKEVKTAKDAIAGACDIIAESISDEADYRMEIRRRTEAKGLIVSTAKDEKAESVYENYYEFSEPVSKIAGHRVLALNRGEKGKFLNVKIEAPTEEILRYLEKKIITKENPQTKPVLQATIEDAYNRLIAPAIEREVRNQLTEKAEDGSLKVFGKNLEQLLMQPPIAGQVVGSKGKGRVQIVVKAVVDAGADGQLHLRPQALHRLRQNVGAGMPVRLAVLLVFKGVDVFFAHGNILLVVMPPVIPSQCSHWRGNPYFSFIEESGLPRRAYALLAMTVQGGDGLQRKQSFLSGAAILAGVACGVYEDIPSACEKVIRLNEAQQPDPERGAQYERYYRLYEKLYPAMKESFAELSRLD